MEAPPSEKRLNYDLECLRCGGMNIPENHICGRCGANLPLLYDEEGGIRRLLPTDRRFGNARPILNPYERTLKVGMWMRLGVILFAIIFALFIFYRAGH